MFSVIYQLLKSLLETSNGIKSIFLRFSCWLVINSCVSAAYRNMHAGCAAGSDESLHRFCVKKIVGMPVLL